jgi:hypothetical protein
MCGDDANRSSRLASLHAAFAAFRDRIGQRNHDLTAVAENVYVRLVSAFIARVNPNLETGNEDFGHDYT